MKPNVWNIKDILNIPSTSGWTKSGKGGSTSDYSNMADTQFLFGSQGCSQEMMLSGPTRSSQHASQEMNDVKVSTSYHSKPLLFGEGKATNFISGKAASILDRFEEEKRKAKESEIVTSGFRQLHESLENIKRTFVSSIDGSSGVIRNVFSEGVHGFRKTIQDDLAILKENIADEIEALKTLLSLTNTEIQDTGTKTSLAIKELGSLLPNLQENLVLLKAEQSKEQNVLGEILKLLGTLMATYYTGARSTPVRLTDSTVQTSPSLVERFSVVLKENHFCEGVVLNSGTIIHSEERVDQSRCAVKAKTLFNLNTGASLPLQDSLSFEKQQQQAFNNTGDEITEPSVCQKPSCKLSVMTSEISHLAPAAYTGVTLGPGRRFVENQPFISSQGIDENSLTSWPEIPVQKVASKRGQRKQLFRKKKRALILAQRQPISRMASVNLCEESSHNEDKENRVPHPAVSPHKKRTYRSFSGTVGLANGSECGQHMDPWSWSQSSNSSQVDMEYQKIVWETPESETSGMKTQRSNWQLFDFIIDSD